jgi:monoamine oxidase
MADAQADQTLDLAIIGGGAAGTAVARAIQRDRPDWAIRLFERTDRIGGRLRSMRVDGLDHPIELGGMRYLTSHPHVAALVESLGLPTHPFDTTGGPERSYLRSTVGAGGADPDAGRGYDLPPSLRGRTALDLVGTIFEQVVPGFAGLDHAGYVRRRASGHLLGKAVTDWAIGDVQEALLGSEGRRFVTDIFGYDSGMRMFCAPDHVEYLSGGGDPTAEARVPDAGMERIPQTLAARFEDAGGIVLLGHDLESMAPHDSGLILRFTNGESVAVARVVLALPAPALRLLASASGMLGSPAFEGVFASVEPFPAMKLYQFYERAWWRPNVAGIRTTTDLAVRKIFYFDGAPGSHSALIAMYTDGRDVAPWASLYAGGGPGAAAPSAMAAEVDAQLRAAHPDVTDIPAPLGTALMYWGADPHDVGWHFWRPGFNSDEVLIRAPQPEPDLPVYLANEAFSRGQGWVEGALEAAEAAVRRIIGPAPR